MNKIIEFPDVKKLQDEIQLLKKSLEDLLLERDELRLVVCENIKTAYMLEIGSLEYKVYKTYCQYLRLRRKKELIQAKKNRQEKIVMGAIENQLDEEFAAYQKKLDEKISEMNEALKRSKMESLSKEETAEFKALYRSIVKRLHPDLNPNVGAAEKELFNHATEAYAQGDISALRAIFTMVESKQQIEDSPSQLARLQEEKERYQRVVDQLKAEIEQIKATPPYSWKIYLENEDKKSQKIEELTEQLKRFQAAVQTQEEYIHDLTRSEI